MGANDKAEATYHGSTPDTEQVPPFSMVRDIYVRAWDSVTDPVDQPAVHERAREEFKAFIEQVRDEAKAEGIQEAVKAVRGVYDMQCPVKPSRSYIHPSVRIAHKWWETCLGGTLDNLDRRAEQIRGGS